MNSLKYPPEAIHCHSNDDSLSEQTRINCKLQRLQSYRLYKLYKTRCNFQMELFKYYYTNNYINNYLQLLLNHNNPSHDLNLFESLVFNVIFPSNFLSSFTVRVSE